MRLLFAIFVGTFLVSGCSKHEDSPKVTISVVIGPEIRGLIGPFKDEFYRSDAFLKSGGKYAIELSTVMAESAAKGIASGETRYDLWIPPSKALVALSETLSRNLGAPPTDCKPLFHTPIVYGVSPTALTFLNDGANKPLRNLIAETKSLGSDDFQTTLGFFHGEPRGSVTGLGSLLQIAVVATGEKYSDESAEKIFNSIRDIEEFALGYGFSETTLLRRLLSGRNRFVITTEQQILLNNLDSADPVRIVYPAEGSFNLSYEACLSTGAWMTREKLEGASLFRDFLYSIRNKASSFGFRPTDLEPPQSGVFANQATNGLDLSKPENPISTADGSLVGTLIEKWRDLERAAAITLVIDHSGSMEGDRLQATLSVARSIIANAAARDHVGVIAFSSEPQIISTPSLERETTIRKLDSMRAVGGSSLYDSIRLALEQLKAPDIGRYRKEIIVFTDGDDKNSSISLSTLLALTKDAAYRYGIRATIIAVSAEDRSDLAEIAEAGGSSLIIASPSDLPLVVEELRKSL